VKNGKPTVLFDEEFINDVKSSGDLCQNDLPKCKF
jgi:hypothetical protein